MIKLNIGCGEYRIEDFVNIDCVREGEVKPDVVCDVRTERLPYEDGTVDEIWMTHSLEHIEMKYWNNIFTEAARTLRANGVFLLSYPEFSECARRFINDTDNKRGFWRATLYGRQMYDSDYHVVPMDSKEIKRYLEAYGFYRISYCSESEHAPYNTHLLAMKDPDPISREHVLIRELHLPAAERDTWQRA